MATYNFNSFNVTAYVAANPTVNSFATASVMRFPISIGRVVTNSHGEETKRVSAIINAEIWYRNENAASVEHIVKGALVEFNGYFKPEEWQSADGQPRNRVTLAITSSKLYVGQPAEESEPAKSVGDDSAIEPQPQPKRRGRKPKAESAA